MIPTVELDPAAMTKEQAGLHFQDRVQQMQKEQRLDLTVAWAQARAMYPELFAKAFPGGGDPANPPKVRLVGSYNSSAQVIPPAATPLPYTASGNGQALAAKLMPSRPILIPNEANLAALGLPADVPYDAFVAAEKANNGASPRNSKAIFNALVRVLVDKGMSVETAEEATGQRYPQIAAEAGQTQPNTN